jgi:cytochrome c-type biogenesis protein CcmH/NrfG
LDDLVQSGHENAAIQRYRAAAALAIGDLTRAEQACQRALALEPTNAWTWATLGQVRRQQGRAGDALRCYQQAVAIEPASVGYLVQLGRLLVSNREYRAAGDVFDRCVRLSPTDAEIRRLSMGAWQLAGDQARMERVFKEGVQLGIPAGKLLGTPDAQDGPKVQLGS